ncbi:hypothetical protein BVC80_1831g174 [Macleaya cordata]|uniref:Plastid division protein PDV2 n=1 Tax=Macleaya cordata TaxID=56857 RepID=A0A200R7B4_MACCD|nr:hypothetical protein BVC80_1831g174 [Macleaya cordata]
MQCIRGLNFEEDDLHGEINNCIEKASERDKEEEAEVDDSPCLPLDDEAESLLNIRDALESLEEQLASFQALQQQQRYEREAILAEIDRSRESLLSKLKDYKGEDLEVIHEASAFASETVQHNNDLLLPPYPSRPPRPLILDKGYPSNFISTRTSTQNGVNGDQKRTSDSDEKQTQSPIKNPSKGLKHIISAAAKTMITIISVISVLSLAGFEPRLRRRSTQFKIQDPFQKPAAEEKRITIECPPGKVLVMENGEPRCLVKERVEIPFESVVTTPDSSARAKKPWSALLGLCILNSRNK